MKGWKIGIYNLYVSESVLELIEKYTQNQNNKNESGGILLGQVKGNDIFVLKSSIPNHLDKSGRHNFERNSSVAQILIDYEFANSCKKTIYLGEWHTHPEACPKPSSIDKEMLRTQLLESKLNESFVLLLIQGTVDILAMLYDGKKFIKGKFKN